MFAIWLIDVGRFCLLVCPGRYDLRTDAWYLDTDFGPERAPSPLARAWDGALLMSEAVYAKLKRGVSFRPAVAFLAAEHDAEIERLAKRSAVQTLWGLEDISRHLAEDATDDPSLNPPGWEQAQEEADALRSEWNAGSVTSP